MKKQQLTLFVFVFLVFASTIMVWANSQTEENVLQEKKDIVEQVEGKNQNTVYEETSKDESDKRDNVVENSDLEGEKDTEKNTDSSNVNEEGTDDQKSEKQGEKEIKKEGTDTQSTQEPDSAKEIDAEKDKEKQIENEKVDIQNMENISKDFQIEGKTLIKYVGTDEKVVVPDGIEVIGKEAFKGNPYVKELILSDSVKCAESEAFAYMENLVTIEKSAEFYTEYDNIYNGSNITYYNVRSNGR